MERFVVSDYYIDMELGEGFMTEHGKPLAFMLGDNFRSVMLSKVEENVEESILSISHLLERSFDASVLAGLGGREKAEITLYELFAALVFVRDADDILPRLKLPAISGYVSGIDGKLRCVCGIYLGNIVRLNAHDLTKPQQVNGEGYVTRVE